MKDTLQFLLKEMENPLLLFKFSDLGTLMNSKKLKELIMKEISEKIPNGMKMDQVFPLLLMLSISDFQATISTILKLMPIWSC